MENFLFFLTPKPRRRWRRDLIRFWDGLALHLKVGYELSYSWNETLASTHFEAAGLKEILKARPEEGGRGCLARLAETYPYREHRLWFGILGELYAQGAGLCEATEAISSSLRQEQERELEAHCRTLPTRTNVWLLIFFLPPAMALLFAPLLDQLAKAF